ncbi:MAG: helix-turn-helix domain-containing protein [Treponema sp.]|uniref:helix-turn-helix domain-containing protein n=1 Tax=Treponema sp. TaxID=166 RepID=UPI003FA307A6
MNIDFLVFFETVKELAKKKNMTIEMMIQSIEGLSFNSLNTYNSMRKARNLPRADDVLRIAKFFGVSVEYLVIGEEPDNSEKIKQAKELLYKTIETLDNI